MRLAVVVATALGVMFGTGDARAQTPDERALQRLASDYALGFHIGDADLMMATTHRDLSKRGVRRVGAEGPEALTWLEGDLLRFMGAHYDSEDRFDEATQRIVNVFAISGDVAALELVAGDWYDAFLAVRTAEGWRLLDCVWGVLSEYEAPGADTGEAALVEGVMRAFVSAAEGGDESALSELLHAQAQVRSFGPDGVLRAMTRDQVYRGFGGAGPAPEGEVFNATQRTASGRVYAGARVYWLQALRIGEDWRIVNVHISAS
ncbi:MAG: nuclear transport factor 2 family protein [Hyphomonadaceae bacterium]